MNIGNDTICAISTPPGRGGIAVARVSGPEALQVVNCLWKGRKLDRSMTHTVHLGNICDPSGEIIDQAVATLFISPGSFTGEDVVEISVHGSTYIQARLMDSLCEAGCRMAGPGEFTRRAFENGRLDLAQAEAVADIIAASSAAAHRLAVSQLKGSFSKAINGLHDSLLQLASLLELELDFSEEDVTFADRARLREMAADTLASIDRLARSFATGDALRRGIPVAIVGQPNAGKSSLLNALLHTDRAIVSDIPGTTRDTVEETTDINGLTFRFIDTAGLRDTDDTIENLGIERAVQKAAEARIVIWLVPADHDSELTSQIRRRLAGLKSDHTTVIPCLSKSDRLAGQEMADALVATVGERLCALSVKDPSTVEALRNMIERSVRADMESDSEGLIVTNARHHRALTQASEAMRRLIDGLDSGAYTDLIAQDLRYALHHLSTITGAITTDTILQSIFQNFCVGK